MTPGIGTRFGTQGPSIGPHRGRSTTTAEFPAPTRQNGRTTTARHTNSTRPHKPRVNPTGGSSDGVVISAERRLVVSAGIFGRCVRVRGQPRAGIRVAGGWRRSHVVRFVVAALVAAVVVASGGAAAGAQESVTVRVAARQVVGGGVEVALQQYSDGSWSARLLPDQRVLPAGAAAGHWLVSTPLGIEGTRARRRPPPQRRRNRVRRPGSPVRRHVGVAAGAREAVVARRCRCGTLARVLAGAIRRRRDRDLTPR